jgi:type 1 glutamine amidotransferase
MFLLQSQRSYNKMRTSLRCGAAALAAVLALLAPARAEGPRREGKIRLLILSGANNHDWKATTPVLRKLYEESGRFTVDVTEKVPMLEGKDFAGYDAVVSNYTTYPKMEGQRWPVTTEKAFLDYVAVGHGFVLFHAASTAWNDWPEFTDLIGLSWQKNRSGHGAYHSFAVTITDRAHPIMKEMKDFQHAADELYHRQAKHATARMLAYAFSGPATGGTGNREPMVLVTEYGKGRVFHNALGHDPKPMLGIGFRTLMLRGTEWAATGAVTIPIPASWPEPGSAAAAELKKAEPPRKRANGE